MTDAAPTVRLQRNLFGKDDVLGEHDTDGWGTPLAVVNPVLAFFDGTIDVDPCTNAHSIVPATTKYYLADDGLSMQWHGRVYCNPPYSAPYEWLKRCYLWSYTRQVEAIALVKGDWTTEWWSKFVVKATARCMWSDRLKFRRADGTGTTANFCSALVYYGGNYARFDRMFTPYGEIQ